MEIELSSRTQNVLLCAGLYGVILFQTFSPPVIGLEHSSQPDTCDAGASFLGIKQAESQSDPAADPAGENVAAVSAECFPGPVQVTTVPQSRIRRPNILIVMADDLGHADLGFSEGSLQTLTPTIDKFAHDGVILNRHYANPLCTPTRGAFMTGKHAFQIGLQTGAIGAGEPWGLPLEFKLQPEYFKELGYSTAVVGKWHLGMYSRRHLPGARGFDHSLVVCGGEANWNDCTDGRATPYFVKGGSLYQNDEIVNVTETGGSLLPELITSTAEKFIREAKDSRPWYLYYATPLTHTPWVDSSHTQHDLGVSSFREDLLMALNKFPDRLKQLAAIRELDRSFGRLINALEEKNELDNTVIAFISDNGAPNAETAEFVHGHNHGSNWPLRMGKGTYFEGGVRTLSFVWSPLLEKTRRLTDQLFHITDWLPTLYEAAGGQVSELHDLAGISQWSSLTLGTSGPRTEIAINIDPISKGYAMLDTDRSGSLYKLIGGNVFDNKFFGWGRTEGTTEDDAMEVDTTASVQCNFPEGIELNACRPHQDECLFDLATDPCEINNVAAQHPDVLKRLKHKVAIFNLTSYPPQNKPFDEASNPTLHGGFWQPWVSEPTT